MCFSHDACRLPRTPSVGGVKGRSRGGRAAADPKRRPDPLRLEHLTSFRKHLNHLQTITDDGRLIRAHSDATI